MLRKNPHGMTLRKALSCLQSQNCSINNSPNCRPCHLEFGSRYTGHYYSSAGCTRVAAALHTDSAACTPCSAAGCTVGAGRRARRACENWAGSGRTLVIRNPVGAEKCWKWPGRRGFNWCCAGRDCWTRVDCGTVVIRNSVSAGNY